MPKEKDWADDVAAGLAGAVVLGTLALGYVAYQGVKAAQRASRKPIPTILDFLGVASQKPEEATPESSNQALAIVFGILGLVFLLFASTQVGKGSAATLGWLGFLSLLAAAVFLFKHSQQQSLSQAEAVARASLTLGFLDTDTAFKPLVVPDDTRLQHMHILGGTGSGKTTLLKNLIIQDMYHGYGLAVIDPKGDLVNELLPFVPEQRVEDVVLFDPTDISYPVGFNILEAIGEEQRSRTASEAVLVFKKLFAESWGPRLENILRFSVLTLLEVPGATLLDIPAILLDQKYRQAALPQVTNFTVREFWEKQYDQASRSWRTEAIDPVLNKVGPWIAYPEVRNIVGQVQSSFNIRDLMDQRKILLVNIPQHLGEDISSLLGAMLVSKIQLAAMTRGGLPPEQRPPFFLYVDEFQNFVTSAFDKILTEARSYGLGLIVANQYEKQLSPELLTALDGNVATRIRCYKHQKEKEGKVEQEWWTLLVQQLQNPEARKEQKQAQLKEDEWGQWLYPFPPPIAGDDTRSQKIREFSRARYGRPRAEVEDAIMRRDQDAGKEHGRTITDYEKA